MARSYQPPPPIPPSIPPDRRAAHVHMLRERGKALVPVAGMIEESRFTAWRDFCNEELVKVFGSASPHVRSFEMAGVVTAVIDEYDEDELRAKELKAKLSTLTALIEILEISPPTSVYLPQGHSPSQRRGENVFVVHGHDEATKVKVARLLEKLHLKPIVLHEKENAGKTIIEKFEAHAADAAFAVVLLTPDDEGRPRTDNPPALTLRARQNVVFELGYFIGALGRPKVCALYAQGVELPSDISGVLYILLDDAGAWTLALAKELKASGLSVDINRLFD